MVVGYFIISLLDFLMIGYFHSYYLFHPIWYFMSNDWHPIQIFSLSSQASLVRSDGKVK